MSPPSLYYRLAAPSLSVLASLPPVIAFFSTLPRSTSLPPFRVAFHCSSRCRLQLDSLSCSCGRWELGRWQWCCFDVEKEKRDFALSPCARPRCRLLLSLPDSGGSVLETASTMETKVVRRGGSLRAEVALPLSSSFNNLIKHVQPSRTRRPTARGDAPEPLVARLWRRHPRPLHRRLCAPDPRQEAHSPRLPHLGR